jgi:hypothetical protein
VRLSRVVPLLAVMLASCGGVDSPRARSRTSLRDYAATTNTMCAELAAAVRRTFADAPSDPVAALGRYARDVHDSGQRFSKATPPASLAEFHARAIRHLARESAALRHAADLSAAGDPAAALDALHSTRLLPERMPARVLRRAPACRGEAAPATPGEAVQEA